MEGSIRHCMLKVSHDEQREFVVERPECRSKCDDGLLKQRLGVGGIWFFPVGGDGVVAMTTLKCVEE